MSADLAKLQRWFQSRTMSGRVEDAARELLPSSRLAADERLAIYSGMYFLRLRDALASDVVAVKALAGDEGWERLARLYVAKHPSKHPSLNRLGDALPRFLAGKVRVPRRALLRDVATVELAMSEVFDERRSPVLDAQALSSVPASAWGKARLELVPALRLLALDHSVNALVTAARRKEPLPAAPRRKSWLAVYRKEWVVWRMELTREKHRLLAALARKKTLARAIEESGVEDPREVFAWFREWREEGFFAKVALAAR